MSLRRIVSLTLMLSAVSMLTTSLILYTVPQGRVAFWAEWKFWGLTKNQWGSLHTNLGLLMLLAAGLHIYYNWRPVTSYLKNKARRFRLFTPNFNVALAFSVVFISLTLLEFPPMAWIQGLRANIEASAALKLGEPPYGHAEESGLRVFLRNVDLDPELAGANLRAAGIAVADQDVTIMNLAKTNGLTPQELYEVMLGPAAVRPVEPQPIPLVMPQGTGRLSLESFCARYNRDVAQGVAILETAGFEVEPSAPLKDLATSNGVEVLDLLDTLRQGFDQ